MSDDTYLEHYQALLAIRYRGTRRNAIILRWALLVALLGYCAAGVLGYLAGPTLYLAMPILIVFGVGYVLAQARHDATVSLFEFASALRGRRP